VSTPTVDTTLEVLTFEQTAALLQIPVATFRGWRERNYGPPGYRVGKHLRFIRAEVIDWLRTNPAGERASVAPVVAIRPPRSRRSA